MLNSSETIGALILAVTIYLVAPCGSAAQDRQGSSAFPEISGPYLGQHPPGAMPEPLAPGILPTEGIQHCHPTFSPDGTEVYWATIDGETRRSRIYFMEERDGQWTAPEEASFSGQGHDLAPSFSPDGRRLYFASVRPDGCGRVDLYFVEQTTSGWSAPVNAGSPPNSENSETQPSITATGTIYYVSAMDSVQWNRGIFSSRWADGDYQAPEALPAAINTAHADAYPFIAPDESYLLFASGRPGLNEVETELYISFRRADGGWSEARNMGPEINNGFSASFPCVTLDGKYLIFNRFDESGTDAFFWMNAGIIESLRHPETGGRP